MPGTHDYTAYVLRKWRPGKPAHVKGSIFTLTYDILFVFFFVPLHFCSLLALALFRIDYCTFFGHYGTQRCHTKREVWSFCRIFTIGKYKRRVCVYKRRRRRRKGHVLLHVGFVLKGGVVFLCTWSSWMGLIDLKLSMNENSKHTRFDMYLTH